MNVALTKDIDRARELANGLEAEAYEVAFAADTLLLEYECDAIIKPGDMGVLRLAGLSDEKTLRAERGRVRNVKEALQLAGTELEFSEAQDRLKAAQEQEQTEKAELEQQLREAQQRIRELREEVESAEEDLHAKTHARERLGKPEILPQFIREQYQQSKLLAEAGVLRGILDRESRIRQIDGVMNLEQCSEQALVYARAQAPELIAVANNGNPYLPNGVLENHKLELKKERHQLQQQYEHLQTVLDEQMTGANSLLRFYLDRIPEK